VNDQTDQQLLRNFTEQRSEAAFTELVRRYVDLVHSAAYRMTGQAHSAQDVTQAVFVALAQNAGQLHQHPALSGWLHTAARNLAAKNVRAAARRQNHEQEAVAMNQILTPAPDAPWEEIAPYLDAAIGELSEPERNVVLLRYFERKSAGEIGGLLGISDEAAQKRVSRAVERLREFFARRGVTVGAGGLAAIISANAVQAAPVGLAVTISAAAVTGVAATTSTVIAATTKTIAMTTLQKTLVTATVAALAGAGIYEARQASQLRGQVQALQQKTAQHQQLEKEHADLLAQLAALRNENDRTKSNAVEVLRLRAELARARNGRSEPAKLPNRVSNTVDSPADLPATQTELPKDSWTDAGFATPREALQTRGWAVLNSNRERFKESVLITDGARKAMEEMLEKMIAAAPAAERQRFSQQILNNNLGLEDGMLFPMIAENQAKGYASYRILSEQTLAGDERLLEVETRMASGSSKNETMRFKLVGDAWKVVIDESFVKSLSPSR
jgi:RNA polymerase sigma factor (sigma-70 family)